MATRRPWTAIVLLAVALHAAGIARTRLPAQDGLKFIRVAHAFQTRPWADVVRESDQHPLYPALVAFVEPLVSVVLGRGPGAWRIAAQVVAAVASVGLLVPLRGLARELFGPKVADLAALGFVLLPLPMAVGHDTLSDSLALLAFLVTLRLGLATIKGGGWNAALGCGLAAGLGYLARPETLVGVAAVVAAGIWIGFVRRSPGWVGAGARVLSPNLVAVSLAFLTIVGGYALVKGEVSEKLALRRATPIGSTTRPGPRQVRQWLPPGLDDPRWDFSPKEETAVTGRPIGRVLGDLGMQWAEGLGWILALFAVWGLARDRFIRTWIANGDVLADRDGAGRLLVLAYLVPFSLILVRHETRMGYLSHRHVLTLVVLSLPWAAAGVFVCVGRAVEVLRGPRFRFARSSPVGPAVPAGSSLGRHSRPYGDRPEQDAERGITPGPDATRWLYGGLLALAVTTSVSLQLKPPHPSRWGHWAAGSWLARNAGPGDAVLDTRGWAAFASGRPSYDYWHVRQALTDSRLAYVVVGEDELRADSRRAETLRAMLAYAGEPAAAFPETEGGPGTGVRVYRYRRPGSWEGLTR